MVPSSGEQISTKSLLPSAVLPLSYYTKRVHCHNDEHVIKYLQLGPIHNGENVIHLGHCYNGEDVIKCLQLMHYYNGENVIKCLQLGNYYNGDSVN